MNWNPLTWFPFTRDGRQTLVYLALAGCGPALTFGIIWALQTIRDWKEASAELRLDKFASLAMMLGYNSIIITVALACFVSIRAVKVSKDGLEATSNDNGQERGGQ